MRLLRPPSPPGCYRTGEEFELLAFQGAADGLAGGVDPQRPRLPVVHDERVLVKDALVPEGERPALQSAAIHDSRLAQRSPGDGDGLAAAGVVAQLVNAHHGDRVGFGLPIDGQANDPVFVTQSGGPLGRHHLRVVEHWKGVPQRRSARGPLEVCLIPPGRPKGCQQRTPSSEATIQGSPALHILGIVLSLRPLRAEPQLMAPSGRRRPATFGISRVMLQS